MAGKKGGLGRGLNSLFDENSTESTTVELKIVDVEPNKNQPRTEFDDESLALLADSIAKHGVLQPIAVRPTNNGAYKIIAGERRWRASRMANLQTIPAIIMEISDLEAMQIALIENLQREDLNPVEEALGYKALIDEHFLTQEQVADGVGKSRSAVANALRLLNLNDDELTALKDGKITAGHARALLGTEKPDVRKAMLAKAISGGSVRELETLARLSKLSKAPKKAEVKSKFYSEVELALKDELHRKVKVTPAKNGHGTLTLEFFSDEELKTLAERIAGEKW